MYNTYCISDLHGNYTLFEKALAKIDETDTLYVLGDTIDRSPDGVKILLKCLNDNRIALIKGNHEDMMAKAIPWLIEGRYELCQNWLYNNGGQVTWDELSKMSEEHLIYLAKRINALPEQLIYKNTKGKTIYLNHAGVAPFLGEAYYTRQGVRLPFLWAREMSWMDRDWTVSPKWRQTYLVCGHTPVQIYYERLYNCADFNRDKAGIKKYKKLLKDPEIFVGADGHYFDLDLGTFNSKKLAFFNLDTFNVEYIYE